MIGTPTVTAFRELFETLRIAAWIFENEKNGRFQGSIIACRAVARFIKRKGLAPQLAAPFMHIAEAFADLERGGKHNLFQKKTAPVKERDRSPERKHMQMLTGVAVEVFVTTERERVNLAAARVARFVKKWPGMQNVTATTVLAWRKQHGESARFRNILKLALEEPKPLAAVYKLLREGPGGFR